MSRQQGFTLLEVMVALAIMAMLAVALTLLVGQVLESRTQLSQSREEGVERLVDFLTRVDHQLSQLVVRRAHERGQVLNSLVLELQNNNRELYWVSGGHWVLPLGDHFTGLRLWRLSWQVDDELLVLESSGYLDVSGVQQWIQVDQLSGVTAVEWSFFHQGGWQPTLGSNFPKGARIQLRWRGNTFERLIQLPEVFLSNPGESSQ